VLTTEHRVNGVISPRSWAPEETEGRTVLRPALSADRVARCSMGHSPLQTFAGCFLLRQVSFASFSLFRPGWTALREKIPGYPAGSKRFSLTATGDVLGLYHPSLSAAFRSRGHNDGTRSRKKAGSDGTLIGSQHSSRHCQPCLD